jgi:cytochrome c biogenesis protein CcmG/thiol:disulfide interchange protein DsbE
MLAGIAILFFIVRYQHSPRITTVGSIAPDIELIDVNKNTLNLSELKSSVLLINFWATWCKSCVDELPSIERLFRQLSGNPKFRLITILYKDDGYSISGYMKENGYTFPVYLNPNGSAAKYFGITGVPETFIIDKKGILRKKIIGPADWDSPLAIEALQNLLNEE